MKEKKDNHLIRRIIGGIFSLFCLFWWLFSILGVFSIEYMLPVGLFLGLLFGMTGYMSIFSKLSMLVNKENSAAGAVSFMWIILFLLLRGVLPLFISMIATFPVWYIVGTVLFFIVSPLIDFFETIKTVFRK